MPPVDEVANTQPEAGSAAQTGADKPGYDKLMAEFIAQPQRDAATKQQPRGYRQMMEEARSKGQGQTSKAGSSNKWGAIVIALAVVFLIVYAVNAAVQRIRETVTAMASHPAGVESPTNPMGGGGSGFNLKPTRFNSAIPTAHLAPSGFRSNLPVVLKPVSHSSFQVQKSHLRARSAGRASAHTRVVNSLHQFVPTRTVGDGTASDPNSESL